MAPLLEVRDLQIHFPTQDGLVKAVDGVSFSLDRGRTLGIVGESGSGKSVTSMGIMGLHHGSKARITGSILLGGEDLVEAPAARIRNLRGNKMAMIFQDPLSSLHPYYKVGDQIVEAYRIHNDVSKQAARKHAIDLLGREAVRLLRGNYERAKEYGEPLTLAARFAAEGARSIHVVDLDGARAGLIRPVVIRALVHAASPASVQASGGVRSIADAQALVDAGASRVVVGTAAWTLLDALVASLG